MVNTNIIAYVIMIKVENCFRLVLLLYKESELGENTEKFICAARMIQALLEGLLN